MSDLTPQEGELILYRTADDAVRVKVLYESETFGLARGVWPSCSASTSARSATT